MTWVDGGDDHSASNVFSRLGTESEPGLGPEASVELLGLFEAVCSRHALSNVLLRRTRLLSCALASALHGECYVVTQFEFQHAHVLSHAHAL